MRERQADLGMIFVAIAFGLGYFPTSQALASNGVFTLLFYRFLLAALIAGAVFFSVLRRVKAADMKAGAILGAFLFAGFVSQTYAFKFAQSSSVAFIIGLNVALVPFIAAVFFKHKIYSYAYAGVAICAAGLYFICGAEVGVGTGEILALVCACAYSFHIVLTAHLVRKCDLINMVYFEILTLVALCGAAIFIFEDGSLAPVIDRAFLIAMAVVGVLGTAFAFFAQALMQKFTTPVKTAIFFTLEPVTAGIVGYFVGGEAMGAEKIAGAALIICGVLVSEIGSFMREKKEAAA